MCEFICVLVVSLLLIRGVCFACLMVRLLCLWTVQFVAHYSLRLLRALCASWARSASPMVYPVIVRLPFVIDKQHNDIIVQQPLF